MKALPVLAAALLLAGCAALPRPETVARAAETAVCVSDVVAGLAARDRSTVLDVVFDASGLGTCLALVPTSPQLKEP